MEIVSIESEEIEGPRWHDDIRRKSNEASGPEHLGRKSNKLFPCRDVDNA